MLTSVFAQYSCGFSGRQQPDSTEEEPTPHERKVAAYRRDREAERQRCGKTREKSETEQVMKKNEERVALGKKTKDKAETECVMRNNELRVASERKKKKERGGGGGGGGGERERSALHIRNDHSPNKNNKK